MAECERVSGEEMDEIRRRTLAYEYLCHLEETKVWLEACLGESLPPSTELEENLRNGVYLAKLAHFIQANDKQKIYDAEQKRYKVAGLQFRHTDNIHQWLHVLNKIDLPKTFHPETTDIYDKKNMPRVICCLHALSVHLFKMGRAPLIVDLYGKATFTDEEISIMSKELQKYGLAMPSFQKIGGMLSKDLGDTGVLHAAIVNINNEIDDGDALESSLLNPLAKLKFVLGELTHNYHEVLKHAKKNKVKNFLTRSVNESYVPDMYDELLTHGEIQGYITMVNTSYTLEKILDCLSLGDELNLFVYLSSPWLKLEKLLKENKSLYFKFMKSFQDKYGDDVMNNIDCLKVYQTIIDEANLNNNIDNKIRNNVACINTALDIDDAERFRNALKDLSKQMRISVEDFHIPLFYEELQLLKIDLGLDLNYDDIINTVKTLSSVACVSKIVDFDNPKLLWEAINNNILELKELRKEVLHEYCSNLRLARKAKIDANLPCTLLTLADIQDCIYAVNLQNEKTCDLIYNLELINEAVKNNDARQLVKILKHDKFSQFAPVIEEESHVYLGMFKTCIKKKFNVELWLEDVQYVLTRVYSDMKEVEFNIKVLSDINSSLLNDNYAAFFSALKLIDDNIPRNEEHKKEVFDLFKNAQSKKTLNNFNPWVVFHTHSGKTAYINMETKFHSWTTPKGFFPESCYFTIKDVASLIQEYSRNRREYNKRTTDMIIKLQARIRGFLVRKKHEKRLFFIKNVKSIVKIQAWWKSLVVQKKYRDIIKQKIEKKILEQSKPENRMLYYKRKEKYIILIQALWRGKRTRQAFLSLFHEKTPSFKAVKYFVPLLDFSIDDYEKEIQLQNLKAEVVQTIRKNNELSKQLDDMDVKIGLLIQNRITLQDVLAHRTKINNTVNRSNSVVQMESIKINDNTLNGNSKNSLKSLTKESRQLIEGYQRLFYMLQTEPLYLSKLLFCLPQSRTNQFLQNVILTLYNFGSNARDEYLLLKLFRYSLEEEINSKLLQPMDAITGNPTVLKMAVNHSRQMNGLTSLRTIVGPLVERILSDKNISIETSPVDIYKSWRNQMESRTGKLSDLPYTVTQEQALVYDEVKFRLKRSLETLKSMVDMFLQRIIGCYDILPFSIIYMARVLYRSLSKKFPNVPEKEILKVVGHLVYYQFINAAIVTPDAFDIVSLPNDRPLSNDQRRNLASIAKILHFSASKKGFGDESAHLQCLNPFIIDCHEKMKNFFRKCCEGPTLEEYFCMDEYSEAALLYKPQIYISVQDICDTHSLLVEYEDVIAPEPTDKLHEILDVLGPLEPNGTIPILTMVSSLSTEVCLTLTDTDHSFSDDLNDISKVFIKTKELCVSVLPFLNGEHLLEAVCIGTTKEQQEQYKLSIQRRLYSGAMRPSEFMTLREHITQLRKYLNYLEDEGYVTREDGYQSVVRAIALDLCHKGKYRKSQLRALQNIKNTKKVLDQKTKFYQDQYDYYNQYINKCLENLNAGKKCVHSMLDRKGAKSMGKMKSKTSIKYSASKLHEKGILKEIDGLTASQFKNVQFEISPTEQNGVFVVRGKFMGVEVDNVEIDIQNLLQLQYDGCVIMDLFGKAKVNVNLLLHLMNRKFYV